MSDSVRLVDLYKTPSEEIRKNRIKFHHLRRNSRESSANWLSRVQKAIDRCKYPSFMIEFMLIDRFICGLIQTETSTIQLASTWSLQQIAEYFVEQPQVVNTGCFHCVSSKAWRHVVDSVCIFYSIMMTKQAQNI